MESGIIFLFLCFMLLCIVKESESGHMKENIVAQKLQLRQEREARYKTEAKVCELESTVAHLIERLDAIEFNTECSTTCPSRPSIAFLAEISYNLNNPAVGHVIRYDKVHTDVGNCYDSDSGVFTVPVNGTYNFNLVASSRLGTADHAIHLHIKKKSVGTDWANREPMGYVFLDFNTDYAIRRTTDVTYHLVEGDEIFVEVTWVRGEKYSLYADGFHNHFSGFLIHAD